jgi:hypothetical protein
MKQSFTVFAFSAALFAACGGSSGESGGADAPTNDAGTGGSQGNRDDAGSPSTPGDAAANNGEDAGEATDATSDSTNGSDAGSIGVGDASRDSAGVSVSDAGAGALVAVPMYVDPSQSPALWNEMYAAGGDAVGLLVMNPNSGPTSSAEAEYTTAIASAHAARELVIGYVDSAEAGKALSDVESEVSTYYAQYPAIDGIFVDDIPSDASKVSSYYVPLYTYIKGKGSKVTVVINPGTMVDESFMTATDILLSWEDTYAAYIDPSQNPPLPSWVKSYPASRFWNIIHTTPAANEANAISVAKSSNVGWIYVTAEGPSAAYQSIESGAYWTTELSRVTAP